MTISKQLYNEFHEPVFKWKVPSKSNPKEHHIVEWHDKEGYFCDCTAFQFSKKPKKCKHIDAIILKYK